MKVNVKDVSNETQVVDIKVNNDLKQLVVNDVEMRWEGIADDLSNDIEIDCENGNYRIVGLLGRLQEIALDTVEQLDESLNRKLTDKQFKTLLDTYEQVLIGKYDDIYERIMDNYKSACEWEEAKQDALKGCYHE